MRACCGLRGSSNLGIEWNAENQLKKVLNNAATIATFAYDPFGRRVEKVAGGTTTTFTYDVEDILRETAGATTANKPTEAGKSLG